jgi:hypothetical protein
MDCPIPNCAGVLYANSQKIRKISKPKEKEKKPCGKG